MWCVFARASRTELARSVPPLGSHRRRHPYVFLMSRRPIRNRSLTRFRPNLAREPSASGVFNGRCHLSGRGHWQLGRLRRLCRPARAHEVDRDMIEPLAGLLVAVLLAAYLLVTLLRPERF
ncbi:K(+)-transporting ATPase subunit F [Xaviernesmea oryzae]|nr:K(+)-transporting ATPase subunit F [Xaviernesmea oryzae]